MASFKTYLAPAALTMALMAAGAPGADAWSRSGSGPRGNSWNSTGAGFCSGATCASKQTFTGPRGTTTRNGSTSCSGGTCGRTGTVTGPNGGSVSHIGTANRY